MIDTTTLALVWLLIALLAIWYDHRTSRRIIEDQREALRNCRESNAIKWRVMTNLARRMNQEKRNREYLEQIIDG